MITTKYLANLYFRRVYIRLVALRMNLYQEVALSFKKVGDPCASCSRMLLIAIVVGLLRNTMICLQKNCN